MLPPRFFLAIKRGCRSASRSWCMPEIRWLPRLVCNDWLGFCMFLSDRQDSHWLSAVKQLPHESGKDRSSEAVGR